MKIATKTTVAVAGSSLMVLSLGMAGIAPVLAQDVSGSAYAANDEQATLETAGLTLVMCNRVEGVFSFTQGKIDSNATIRTAMAPQYLCGAAPLTTDESAVPAAQWTITVTGDVANAFTATQEELVEEHAAQLTMSCSCAGNVAGGRASITAKVLGIDLKSIMADAQVNQGVNTIVFTCADGYEIALPLLYVVQHYSILATGINDEPVNNSMGGTNQLWIGSTAANYYARNVVRISFETWDNPPARPGLDSSEAANVPNISIIASEG